jgi:hypothetical protein
LAFIVPSMLRLVPALKRVVHDSSFWVDDGVKQQAICLAPGVRSWRAVNKGLPDKFGKRLLLLGRVWDG